MKTTDKNNSEKINSQNSIVYKLTIFAISIIIIQTMFITGSLIFGGVLKESRNNAMATFNEKVNGRKNYLEREMRNRWTNLDPFLPLISDELSKEHKSNEVFLSNISELMTNMLRSSQTTGVYLMLTDDINEKKFDSIYLRDYDPLANNYSNNDIYMVIGPPDIAKNLKIPLDQSWKYDFELTDMNQAFFLNPYSQAHLTNNSKFLGYWSKPFQVSEKDLYVITYSMPIFDLDNQLRGIIGIEISLNYLFKQLPATDLQQKDSLGYMIAYKEREESDIQAVVTNGALQKRFINTDEPLEIQVVDSDSSTYIFHNHKLTETIYANMEKIGLYQHNTPFESESWYLVGLMREDDLFAHEKKIEVILLVTFGLSLILGLIGSGYFSFKFSKPIIELADKVRTSDKEQKIYLDSTGLNEVDELARAISIANNEKIESASRLTKIIDMLDMQIGAFEINSDNNMLFTTEKLFSIMGISESISKTIKGKDDFMIILESIFSRKETEENDVYKVEGEISKWLKINMTESENTIIGVVQDVTIEMLDKLEIIKDRDLDPLTKLYNRKAFQYRFEEKYLIEDLKVAALIMFDLDDLKLLNDTYGHKWGDIYIIEATNCLMRLANDNQRILGRRSGDEFVALIYGYDTKIDLELSIKKFFNYIERTFIAFPNNTEISISISGGLIWLDYPELKYEELLHRADEALYKAKRFSKGNYVVYK